MTSEAIGTNFHGNKLYHIKQPGAALQGVLGSGTPHPPPPPNTHTHTHNS